MLPWNAEHRPCLDWREEQWRNIGGKNLCIGTLGDTETTGNYYGFHGMTMYSGKNMFLKVSINLVLIWISNVSQLESLNLGNNLFEELPLQLKTCINIRKLHLFGNDIKNLSPLVLGWYFCMRCYLYQLFNYSFSFISIWVNYLFLLK